MAIYENSNHPAAAWGQQINAHLADLLGGSEADYQVWWGGVNPNYVRVQTEQPGDLAAAMVAFGAVTVQSDKAVIAADGVDEADITCGVTVFDYQIKRDGVVITSGTVNDGVLEFSTDTTGVYLISIYDDDETGYIEIEAV